MANLAIRGHATRGKEVIEILEMLGGINPYACKAVRETCFYFIVEGEIDYDEERYITDEYTIFTLEEFLEKFPYKIGDKVSSKYLKNYKIERMEWEDANNRVIYKLQGMGWYNANELQPYKEENFGECIEKTIQECLFGKEAQMYLNELANKRTEEIVQALKPAKEIMDRKYNVEEYLKVWKETEKGLEVVVNDRFELKEDNGKFYIIKKPVQYPKTYKECCDVLGLSTMDNDAKGYKDILIIQFQELLIARDAYWKIAGEQMGLGEPWKPDWLNVEQDKFVLYTHDNVICFNRFVLGHNVLAFPTAEIRDAFLDNFKKLIEHVKELL